MCVLIVHSLLVLKCDDPPAPSNGDFMSNGSVVTYMCEEGFVLVGNRQRFCNLTTWLWNGSDPICESMYIQLSWIPYMCDSLQQEHAHCV